MALPFAFTGNLTPTGEQLDADLAALGALVPLPCVVAGTSSLTLTPQANTPVPAYTAYAQFTGIAAATNNGTVQAQIGALALLGVYKDTAVGPVLLSGFEIVANTKIVLMYDPALAGGAGGFHLVAPASLVVREHVTVAGLTVAALVPGGATTATVALAGCSIGDVVGIGYTSLVQAALQWTGFVSDAGTVQLKVVNFSTSATVTPVAGNYTVATRGYTA